jgi:glycosyltransferase involved in cell wall biosynthesis
VRILQVISGYLPHETAGMQVHVRDLCHGLRQRGHEVEVFTRLAGKGHQEFELSCSEWEGIRVTRITNNFDDVDRFELLYTHPTIDARFDRFLDEVRPDLVHVHHLTCLSTSMIEVARRRGIPVVMTFHDYWMVCLRGQRIRPEDLGICDTLDRERCLTCLNRLWPHLLPLGGPRSLIDRLRQRPPSLRKLAAWETHVRRMLDACQALTAPARFHRERFIEWGIAEQRLFLVPYGFAKDSLRGEPRGRKPVGHIGFIGSVIPSKGVHILCAAFNRLGRRDLVLHIHGEPLNFHGDTGYAARLQALIDGNLDVRFHGRYENRDVAAILAGLDVLVVPSVWWENSPLTVREGALAGLTVIASRLGGLEEAVQEGVALGFRGGDPEDLARVLSRVLAEPQLRDEMSRKGDLVCDLETSVGRMEEIYHFAVRAARGDTTQRPAALPRASA